MAQKTPIYDDKEENSYLDNIKSQEGLAADTDKSEEPSEDGENKSKGFYNNGLSSSSGTTSSDSLKTAEEGGDSESDGSQSSDNQSSGGFYSPSKKKNKSKSKGSGNSKGGRNALLLGGGGGALIVVAMLVFLFISSLLIPNLAQNILTYQFARVNRNFLEDNLELTSEKVAVDSLPTDAAEATVNDEFDNSTDGFWAKLNSFTPSGVVKNLKTDGHIQYNYGRTTVLRKKVLTDITIDGESYAVKNTNLASKFNALVHPIQSFQDQVNAAKGFSTGLDNVMRDDTGIIIRGSVENDIRKQLGISLTAYVASKFKGDTPTQASDEMDREVQKDVDPPDTPLVGSVDDTVKSAEAAEDQQIQQDVNSDSALEAARAAGGIDQKADAAANNVIDSVFSGKSVLQTLNPVYAVAVPVCIIYDGSLSNRGDASQNINNQDGELQRSFYEVESAADQQKAGATNSEAVGAMNTKLVGAANSNAELRASGKDVDTLSSIESPQAGAGGQYSIADSLLPSPLSGLADNLAGPFCPVITNLGFVAAATVGVLIATIVGGVATGGATTATETAASVGADGAIDAGLDVVGEQIAQKTTSEVVSQTIRNYVGHLTESFTKKELAKVTAVTALTILAKMDVLSKANETYNGLSQGTDFANQADEGGNLNANQVEQQEFYGAPLANNQVAYNNASDKQYIAEQNKSQNAYQRYLAISNANSLISKMAVSFAATVNMKSFTKVFSDIGSFLSPLKISSSLFGFFNHTASAATSDQTDNSDYGIVQWGYTSQEDALINPNSNNQALAASYQPLENAKILHDSGAEDYIQQVYGACFTDDMGTLLTQRPPGLFGVISNPDPSAQAWIVRDKTGNVIDGLCSEAYLGPNSADQNMHDGKYGNDLIFRWRLAQSYNAALDQLNGLGSAATPTTGN